MASLESALYHYMSGLDGLRPLVGSHIYPAGGVPEKDENEKRIEAYVTYQRIDATHDDCQDGSTELARARMQINCVALAVSGVDPAATSEAIRRIVITESPTGLRNFRGLMGDIGSQVDVKRAVLITDSEIALIPLEGKEGSGTQGIAEFDIWYVEE